jgi:hypothetical protein
MTRLLLGLAIAIAGCGSQAGGNYMGEPMLSMRVQATVSALTDGQAMVPALCFFNVPGPVAPFDTNKLPADVRPDLAYESGLFSAFPFGNPPQTGTSILDVESRGQFPSEFDIDVYLPPAEAAVTAPLFPDEPRSASGYICAVRAGHLALTHALKQFQIDHCDGTCFRELIFASYDTPRFEVERYDCPTATTDQEVIATDLASCNKTT